MLNYALLVPEGMRVPPATQSRVTACSEYIGKEPMIAHTTTTPAEIGFCTLPALSGVHAVDTAQTWESRNGSRR